MKISNLLFLVGWALISLGCHSDRMKPEEYIQWVENEENGLKRVKNLGDYVIEVQSKPLKYSFLKENGQEGSMVGLNSKKGDGMAYFTIKMSTKKGDLLKVISNNSQELYDAMYYFSFVFQRDISMESGERSVPCELFHFERSYDLSPFRTFVIGFPQDSMLIDQTVVLDCNRIGLSVLKFRFKKEDLEKESNIQIQL